MPLRESANDGRGIKLAILREYGKRKETETVK